MSEFISQSPNGESFPLPDPEDYAKEFKRLKKLVAKQRKEGREVVVVMGVGFVGAVMAAIVADSVQKPAGEFGTNSKSVPDLVGTPNKFVIGMQRPSTRSFWKIPYLNRGIAPVEAEDPDVARLIARCVNEKKTLTATYTYEALTLADVVVVDVQCDYFKADLWPRGRPRPRTGRSDPSASSPCGPARPRSRSPSPRRRCGCP